MICDLCKREFEESQGRQACTACGFIKGCGGVRCPYCYYEMVPQPEWMKRLVGFFQKRGRARPALGGSSVVSLRGGRKADEGRRTCAGTLKESIYRPVALRRDEAISQIASLPSVARNDVNTERGESPSVPVCLPLTALPLHTKAEINHLETGNPLKLKKLVAMGTLPGSEITLLQRFPSYVFQIGWSQFSVDKELASSIYVRAVT